MLLACHCISWLYFFIFFYFYFLQFCSFTVLSTLLSTEFEWTNVVNWKVFLHGAYSGTFPSRTIKMVKHVKQISLVFPDFERAQGADWDQTVPGLSHQRTTRMWATSYEEVTSTSLWPVCLQKQQQWHLSRFQSGPKVLVRPPLDGFICIAALLLPSHVFVTAVVRLRHVASVSPIAARRGSGGAGWVVVFSDKGVAVKSERAGWWRGSFTRSCSSRPQVVWPCGVTDTRYLRRRRRRRHRTCRQQRPAARRASHVGRQSSR